MAWGFSICLTSSFAKKMRLTCFVPISVIFGPTECQPQCIQAFFYYCTTQRSQLDRHQNRAYDTAKNFVTIFFWLISIYLVILNHFEDDIIFNFLLKNLNIVIKKSELCNFLSDYEWTLGSILFKQLSIYSD